MRRILIIGATSAVAADLTTRTATLDVTGFAAHAGVIEPAEHEFGGLETLLIARHADGPDQL